MPKLLTLREMASELGVHAETLRSYVRSGYVRFLRLPTTSKNAGELRFNPQHVLTDLRKRK